MHFASNYKNRTRNTNIIKYRLTLFESMNNQKPGYGVPLWLWHTFKWWNVHGTDTVRSLCTHNSERKQGETMEKWGLECLFSGLALKATRDKCYRQQLQPHCQHFPCKTENLKIPPEEQQRHAFNLQLQWTWTEIKIIKRQEFSTQLIIPHQHDLLIKSGFNLDGLKCLKRAQAWSWLEKHFWECTLHN